MSENLESHHVFWRLVKGYGLSLNEADSMTYDMMMEACAYLDMTVDYKNAWTAYYEIKSERKTKGMTDGRQEGNFQP